MQLSATPWTVACQAPLSMGFSRQEYWSGLLFPSPGDLPDPGIEPRSPALQADFLPPELPREMPPKLTLGSSKLAKNFLLFHTQLLHFLYFLKNLWPCCPLVGSHFLVHVCVLSHFSHVRLFATLWTVAHQAALPMGFSRQEY